MPHGSSLNQAAKALQAALGENAPARITLHRHSASGALDAYVVRQSGSRRYYDASKLVDHYRAQRAELPQAQPQTSAIQTSAAIERSAEELIQLALPLIERRIAEALAPTEAILAKLSGQIGDLATVRQTLMLKYDAVGELNLQKLRRAEEDLVKARKDDAQAAMTLSKIAIEVSRIRDALAQLTNRQG